MPNKPHPPRKKPANSSASSATALNGEDTSFIVFGNDSKSKKKGKPFVGGTNATPSSSSAPGTSNTKSGKKSCTAQSTTGSSGAATNGAETNEASKKPDTRTLISGSASWTGKLPMNLLSEHCQRSKWEKPEYTMTRVKGSGGDGGARAAPADTQEGTGATSSSSSGGGYVSAVILRHKNPKTGQITALPPIALPAIAAEQNGAHAAPERMARDSPVEARHLAAAWALYRVASAKNLGMALPPAYRDLWRGEFKAIKERDVAAGKAGLYEADPFAARARFEEEVKVREKERAEREVKREVERKEREEGRGTGMGKGWQRAPKVDMGRRMRREVEALVRGGVRWNVAGSVMTVKQKGEVVKAVEAMGFRRSHVLEAAEVCRDQEETLEWLLIHVPEDDLPKWCLPENYTAGVSLASGDLQREGKVKRLAAAGYAIELCTEALAAANEDEDLAAERLQGQLLGQALPTEGGRTDSEFWNEEQAVLEAIFGDRFSRLGNGCRIVLEVVNHKGKASLRVRRPVVGQYPQQPPVIAVEAELPTYIRLAITKQAIESGLADQMGEQMLFNLVDWLEQNITRIANDPGPLKSISTAVGADSADKKSSSTKRGGPKNSRLAFRPRPQDGQKCLEDWTARQATAPQQKMNSIRQNLPAWKLRDEIVSAVTKSQVTIISGETGSGKSTQSVQFILDDLIQRQLGGVANIVCTQPRRISALGLADRVAEERCSTVGQEVGYSIRGESRQKPGITKITFVTTGVLLRRLQTSGGDAGGIAAGLADISHVVIDEVHERSLDTDFLMTLLRDVLRIRKDLKLILMSATLDAELFESYFTASTSVAKIQIAGRTYPVRDVYLEDVLRMTNFAGRIRHDDDDDDNGGRGDGVDLGTAVRAVGARLNYDLIATTVDYIDHELTRRNDPGAILIFLPGVAEIDRSLQAIRRLPGDFMALPLHASLQPTEQRRVFPRAPPGKRKVICSTNVAETSITIEDVVAVVDTGKVKETNFDPVANMVRLEEVWASKAACKQRRGRAGRVSAGTCYKLFTKNLEATKMAERPLPEIKRVPLEQLCLSVKAMGVDDVQVFLGKALTPPETTAITGALRLLDRMSILDAGHLTALGRHLSLIPADLRCGKLLVLGATFGCVESCLIISSILSVKSPFVSPQDKREEAKSARLSFSDGGSGDLLCDLRAVQEWRDRRKSGEPPSSLRAWCGQNFLSPQTLQDIWTTRTQYLANLQDIQFVPFDYNPDGASTLNRWTDSAALLRALITAAFTPQVARIEFPDAKYIASVSGTIAQDPEARTIKFFSERTATDSQTSGNDRVFIHPSSTLLTAQSYPTNTAFMSYFTKMATSKVFIRDLTPCNAYALLMFGGSLQLAAQNGGGILIDEWIRVRGWARIGVLVSRLRSMLDELLEKKLDDPGMDMDDAGLVAVVKKLIELNGMDH